MATFFDDFERADAPTPGNGWLGDGWPISGGKIAQPGYFDSYLLRPDSETPKRVRITVRADLSAGFASDLIILKRDARSNDFYYVWLANQKLYASRAFNGNISNPPSVDYASSARTLDLIATIDGDRFVAEVRDPADPATALATLVQTLAAPILDGGQNGLGAFANGLHDGVRVASFEVENLDDSGASTSVPPFKVVVDGDSISQDGGYWLAPASAVLGAKFVATPIAVSGQTLAQMLGDFSTQVPPMRDPSRAANVLVCFGGTNGVSYGATAATVIDQGRQYCQLGKSAGFATVLVSMLPRGGGFGPDLPGADLASQAAEFEVRRSAVNAYHRLHWREYADAWVDLDADARLANTGSTTFYGDTIHPTSAGGALIGPLIASGIFQAAVGNGGPGPGRDSSTSPSSPATGVALVVDASTGVGQDAMLAAVLTGGAPLASPLTVSLSSPGATLGAASVTIAAGATFATTTFTPTSPGPKAISGTAAGLTVAAASTTASAAAQGAAPTAAQIAAALLAGTVDGESIAQVLRLLRAEAVGQIDRTTVPGTSIYLRPDGRTEAFRRESPDNPGRPAIIVVSAS